jgi:hypothetical protein
MHSIQCSDKLFRWYAVTQRSHRSVYRIFYFTEARCNPAIRRFDLLNVVSEIWSSFNVGDRQHRLQAALFRQWKLPGRVQDASGTSETRDCPKSARNFQTKRLSQSAWNFQTKRLSQSTWSFNDKRLIVPLCFELPKMLRYPSSDHSCSLNQRDVHSFKFFLW